MSCRSINGLLLTPLITMFHESILVLLEYDSSDTTHRRAEKIKSFWSRHQIPNTSGLENAYTKEKSMAQLTNGYGVHAIIGQGG